MRLLIEGCHILDPDVARGYKSGRYIVIEDNTITAITSQRPNRSFDRVLYGADRLAIPGLINAHTHSSENFLRATTDKMALEPWLVYLFGMSGEYSPRDHYLSTMLGAIEMLRTGVTSVVDHLWMSPAPNPGAMDAAMEAYRDSGMRAAVAPLYRDAQFDIDYGIKQGYPLGDTFFAQLGKKLPPLADVMQMLEAFFKRWHGAEGGRLHCFVGPSGLQWCTEELLQEALALTRRYHSGFHIHLLETRVQDLTCRQRFGCSGVQWLAKRGLLGPEVSLAHSVFVTRADLEQIAEAGASVVHNPASNLKLGSGLAPVRAMLDTGVSVALGTDGAASNDNQVLFEALRLVALIHSVSDPDPESWISAREAWHMVTEAGAIVLGEERQLGKLEAGCLADIVLLDLASPHLIPLNDAYRHLAFCESGSSVRTVIVDGKIVMDEGRIETFDEEAILAEARRLLAVRAHGQPIPPDVETAIQRFAVFRKEVVNNARY